MALSWKAADRLASIAVYTGFGCLTIWAGIALINHSLDSKFYKDFLLAWEVALHAYGLEGGSWPHFSGGNHVKYMDQVARLMSNRVPSPPSPPASNTVRPYVYRLHRIGAHREDIFLLCFPQRMILYGISAKTFACLDTYIDGGVDPKKGVFTGRPSSDGLTYIGRWQI